MAVEKLLRVRFLRTHRGEDGASIAVGTKVELPRAAAQKLLADGIVAPASRKRKDEDEEK